MALALDAHVGQGAGGRTARRGPRVPADHLRPALPADDRARLRTRARPAPARSANHRPVVARRAARTVAFSAYVADRLGAVVVPLTSDVPDADVPPEPAQRRDFVLYGRMSPYKNVPVALRAWQAHVESDAYRGDRLLLIGDGP